MKTLLLSEWIATMTGPLIQGGGVLVDAGVILDVGAAKDLARSHPDAALVELGQALLMPGLVNAHTHLELSDLSPPHPSPPFIDWLAQMIQKAAQPGRSVPRAVDLGIAQSLRSGVTCVADISRQFDLSRPALAQSPLRATSFGEITAMGQRRVQLESRISAAAAPTPGLTIGLEPHAPYSIEPDGYRRCVQVAREKRLPLTTHLAEFPHESSFLSHCSGPLRQLWETLPWFDDRIPRFHGGPIRLARACGLLDYPTLLAHVNYCDDDELTLLAAGRASVIYCPRTHAYFGHPPHRWRDMLARGINVALGTDSCASSPDLNLLDDLRMLHAIAPDVPAMNLLELATLHGARALGRANIAALSPGMAADLAAFELSGPDPLQCLLESNARPTGVWIAGQRLI